MASLRYDQLQVWPPAGHAALGSLAAMSKALVVFSLLAISFWSPREVLGRAQETLPSCVGHMEQAVEGQQEETQMGKGLLFSPARARGDTVTSEVFHKDCLRRFTFKTGWRVNGE